ncbi:MAG: hypothetical protein ABEH43_00955, partial [Flavobacteriales bacterium]
TAQESTGISDIGAEDITSTDSTNVSCTGNSDGSAMACFTCNDAPCDVIWTDASDNTLDSNRVNTDTCDTLNNLSAGNYTITIKNNSGCKEVQIIEVIEPTLFESNDSIVNISCAGACDGKVFETPSGSNGPPYDFTWKDPDGNTIQTSTGSNDSITGLCPGTYTLSVNDSMGCDTTFNYNITQPDSIEVDSINITNVSCNGDSNGVATVFISGGTSPYSYQWKDDDTGPSPIAGETDSIIQNVPADTFILEATDDNNCSIDTSVEITQPDSLEIDTSATNVLCNGDSNGTVVITPNGGTPQYNYTWTDTSGDTVGTDSLVQNLAPGNYIGCVTDSNGCSSCDTVTVNEPPELTVTIDSLNQISCNDSTDGSIFITSFGGSGVHSYVWVDTNNINDTIAKTEDLTDTIPGDFKVIVTDTNNCTAMTDTSLIEPDSLSASLSSDSSSCTIDDGKAIVDTVTGGTPGYDYNWLGDDSTSIGKPDSAVADSVGAGIYYAEITDTNSCKDTFLVTVSNVNAPTIIEDSLTHVGCKGDSSGAVFITATGDGTLTYKWTPSGDNTEDLTGVGAGIHTVEVTDSAGCKAFTSDTLTEPDSLLISLDTLINASCKDT